MELQGKHAIVTGSTRGIGRAIAAALFARGCRVVLNGCHDPAQAGRTAQALLTMDRVGMLVMADASTGEGARLLIEQAVERFGPIDILVHSVGGICHRDWDDYSETEWQAMLDLNLTSAWRCARVAKPFFSEGGAILFISSSSAFNLELDALPYSVAKAGLLTFTRGLASILAPAIRVNALAPGYVDTEFDLADMQNRERISSTIPAGRFARPEEVAHAALALLENDYITGQFLTVDGGESLINWGT